MQRRGRYHALSKERIILLRCESLEPPPVKVTPGFYLIGLSNHDADKERNLPLLKERAWLDIPIVYNNNRRAILAMDKGIPGERVFADAFKAWSSKKLHMPASSNPPIR
jgi:hypothetical protein